jgi:hypothetical protein
LEVFESGLSKILINELVERRYQDITQYEVSFDFPRISAEKPGFSRFFEEFWKSVLSPYDLQGR